jgi:fumarylacetoacetase
MTYEINETNDPNLKSWVESANDPNTDFPIQNLPFCVHKSSRIVDIPSLGIPIGDQLLDLTAIDADGSEGTGISLVDDIGKGLGAWTDDPGLDWSVLPNGLQASIRRRISELLRQDNSDLRDHPNVSQALIPLKEV